MNDKDDKFYLDIVHKLIKVLGNEWSFKCERYSNNTWFYLKQNDLTFASSTLIYDLLKDFVRHLHDNFLWPFITCNIPDYLNVNSIEELIVQLDLHCD